MKIYYFKTFWMNPLTHDSSSVNVKDTTQAEHENLEDSQAEDEYESAPKKPRIASFEIVDEVGSLRMP